MSEIAGPIAGTTRRGFLRAAMRATAAVAFLGVARLSPAAGPGWERAGSVGATWTTSQTGGFMYSPPLRRELMAAMRAFVAINTPRQGSS